MNRDWEMRERRGWSRVQLEQDTQAKLCFGTCGCALIDKGSLKILQKMSLKEVFEVPQAYLRPNPISACTVPTSPKDYGSYKFATGLCSWDLMHLEDKDQVLSSHNLNAGYGET
ncbi:hypothetical protein VNO78_05259 [Psophocarpus tetragonolobus]|uniref:Uncharacterized protein n=1 Tax=Psophocarpus tetragonolobus TaxID=3891 RepID=A0AAN9XQB0_PSOTE